MSRPKTIEPLRVTYHEYLFQRKVRKQVVFCTRLQSIGNGDLGLVDCRGSMIHTVHHDMLVAVVGNPVLSKYHENKKAVAGVKFRERKRVVDKLYKHSVKRSRTEPKSKPCKLKYKPEYLAFDGEHKQPTKPLPYPDIDND